MTGALLRFVMCGSVDDGKSTLIGRLLYDNLAVLDDQLKALECDSRRFGTRHGDLDFALLVDGLQAEREQAITIDVAHRFFRTPKRAFIVADAPGHEQYTRNMATAASTAEAAVVLVDARHGVVSQTRRHTRILGMFGVSQVILAVNKMDLVDWSEPAFAAVVAEYESLAAACGIAKVSAVPTCAVDGDNVATRSDRLGWYRGQTLTELLESADPAPTAGAPTSFRMPVQLVVRPHEGFRGFAGRVVSGTVKPGDRICVMPSGATSRVRDVIGSAGPNAHAGAGDSIMVTVEPPVDVSRGDVLCSPEDLPSVTEQFEARLQWMGDAPLIPGRQYILKLATRETPATVTAIKFRDDVESGAHLAARTLSLNETALVNFSLAQPVVFEPYHRSRALGGFILIDRETFATVGAGMIYFGLRRDANIHWQSLAIDREARAQIKQQRPVCLWLTGLSGSGKSTIANLLEKRLHAEGRHTYVLDGDNVRHGLNRDLGFTEADRVENIRRVSEVAKLMVDAGLIVIVSFISPFRAERRMARQLFDAGGFVEVFVDTPIEECEKRDPKGLYAKVRAGQLANFTGVDSPYERPESPEVRVATAGQSAEACAEQVYQFLSSLV